MTNQIEYDLCQNDVIDHKGAFYTKNKTQLSWLIIQVRSTLKMKLNCHDRSNNVRYMMNTRHDNNVIDHIGTVYAENEIELSLPINTSQSMTKTRRDNDVIDHIGVVYLENKIELSWPI